MTHNPLKHRSKRAEALALEGENKLLALWEKENHWLRYSFIVRAMKAGGIIPRRTARLLQRLVKRKILDKMERKSESLYRRLDKPKEYDAVESTAALNKRITSDMAYEFDVGGVFSHAAFGRLIGFPNLPEKELREDEAAVLHDLTTRLGFVYHAMLELRNAMLLRRLGVNVPIEETALQEFIAQRYIIWYLRKNPNQKQLLEGLKLLNPDAHDQVVRILEENKTAHKELPEMEMLEEFDLADSAFADLGEPTGGSDEFEAQSLQQLLAIWREVIRQINDYTTKEFEKQRKTEPEGKFGMLSVQIPDDLSHKERELRRAMAVKIAESLHARGLNEMNELGLLLTSHPRTSNVHVDEERLVYEMMEDIERFERKLVPGSDAFAMEAGKMVAHYNNLTIESVQALRGKNWFKRYIGQNWKNFTEGFVKAREEMREDDDDFEKRMFGGGVELNLKPNDKGGKSG